MKTGLITVAIKLIMNNWKYFIQNYFIEWLSMICIIFFEDKNRSKILWKMKAGKHIWIKYFIEQGERVKFSFYPILWKVYLKQFTYLFIQLVIKISIHSTNVLSELSSSFHHANSHMIAKIQIGLVKRG